MKYTKFKLSNGSILCIINTPGSYTATISAFIKAGFKFDPSDKPGLAHFTEHMLFDGSKNYSTPAKTSWAIERFGGWHYAFTWIEHQEHIIHLPKDNYEEGVKVLVDLLTYPLINKKEFQREKGMVKEEILRNFTDPEKAVLDYAWQPLFFNGTSLARPYSGTKKDIDKISIQDVEGFLNQNFSSSSIVFLVAGDISDKKCVESFEKYIKKDNIKEKKNNNPVIVNSTERVNVYTYKTEQVAVVCGIKTVPFNEDDKYKIEMIKDVLGGYFGARLPQKLRDEGGLIYNWNIWQDNLMDSGYLVFSTSTAKDNVYKLTEIILQEFLRLRNELINKEELDVVKGHIMGSLFCNNQTGFELVKWYGLQEVMGKEALSLEEQAKIYGQITADQLQETAKKYFTKENIYISVLGKADKEKLTKLLN